MTPRFYAKARLKEIAGFVILFSFFLSAYALACLPEKNPNDEKVGDPVSVTSGMLTSSNQDIFIPAGRGELPLEISRNSYGYDREYFKDRYISFLGYGWTFNYGMNITTQGSTMATLVNENGEREIYNWDSWFRVWVPPKGNFSTLIGGPDYGWWYLRRKNGKGYLFDGLGRLTNITDRNGNQISITYISGKRIAAVTDSCGRSLTFSYNANGLISSIAWPNGEVTTYDYEAKYVPASGGYIFVLTKVTDPEGNEIKYTYSSYDLFYALFIFEDYLWQLTAVTDPSGNITTFSYYDENPIDINYLKCKQITYADGTHMDFSYNESLHFTLVTDERYYTTRYDYDSDEKVTDITDPLGNKISYHYDADFNKDSVTDARTHTTYYGYDNKGNCTSITDPLSRISSFTYEPRYSFVKTATDPKGKTTTYYYDYEEASLGDLNGDGITNQANGNLVKLVYPAVDAGTPAELFVYNQYGQIIQQTDPKGTITKYDYYSATGYLEKKISDYGGITSTVQFGYDMLGNVTSVTDPLGRTTTSEYNKIGLLKKSISPAPFNYQTKYTYDGNKNPTKIERQLDEAGSSWQVVENTYDNRDRLSTIKEYLSGSEYITTTFHYDAAGNKDSQTDPNGNPTTYAYDERNLLIRTTDAEGNQTEYTYYPDNKLKSIKDPKTNLTTYEYDDSGWLIKTTYPDGSYEIYTPDLNSNLALKMTRRGDIISYSYDNLNRLTSKICSSYPTVSYTYDIASRLTNVSNGGYSISYSYDNLNRITQVSYPGAKNVAYQYDNASNRLKLTYPDNTYITYEYDELSRLKIIKDQTAQIISQYTYDPLSRRLSLDYQNNTRADYSYDNLGRLLNKINKRIAGPDISSFAYTYDNASNRLTMTTQQGVHSYTYDRIYQLKDVDYSLGYPFSDTFYYYDPAGNRTQLSGGTIETYTSNNLNQYTSVNSVNYSYDGSGNLTSDGIFTYSYDYENRLILASKIGTTATYTYDPLGRRIKKYVNGSITNYIHDGDQIIAEYDSSGTLTKKFIYGPDIDEPILMDDTTNKYYYHLDGLGSVTELTDASRSVIERYSYDIYGKVIIKDANGNVLSQSQIGNSYFFTSRELDPETGLYYYRARYYSPLIGRFLQTDPVGYSAGINLYTYCSNNPVNFTDPMGLDKKKELTKEEKEELARLARWLKFNKRVADSLLGKYGEAGLKEGLALLEGAGFLKNGKPWWQKLEEGRYYGTGFGEEALQWYAQKWGETGNPIYAAGGAFAALWTPETYQNTGWILIAASSVVAKPGHVGLDLPGKRNIIHFGKNPKYGETGRHIGIWFKKAKESLWHYDF